MAVDRVILIWNPKLKRPGSGYLVRADLVLTARHVLFRKDEPDDRARMVKIRTRAQAQVGGRDWAEATCPWSTVEHDLGLLRLQDAKALCNEAPRGVAVFRPLPRDQFVDGVKVTGFPQFRAQGFPGAIAPNGAREALFAQGKVHDPGQAGDDRLPLEITTFGPNEALREGAVKQGSSWWGGMSGAALLHREAIVGVAVVDAGAGLDRSVLKVVPIRLVLNDPKFRRILGLDELGQRRAHLAAELAPILKRSARAVAQMMEVADLMGGAQLVGQDKAAALAQHLVSCSLPDVLVGLREAYDELERAQPADDARVARGIIADAAQFLAPCLQDEMVVSEIRAHKLDGDRTVFDVPCVLPMVAEVFMAGADGRPTAYRPRRSETDYPEGIHHLPAPPETGIAGPVAEAEAIRESLMGKFAPGRWEKLREAINDYVFDRFAHDSPSKGHEREKRVKVASAYLKNASQKETYYMVYRLPDDDDARRELEMVLRQVQSNFPSLVFLGLSNDADTEVAEVMVFGHLQSMLPLRG